MGEIDSKTERIILAFIVCITCILSLVIYRIPVDLLSVRMIYVLVAVLVIAILAMVCLSYIFHVYKSYAEIRREEKLLKIRQEYELEKEKKLIDLRDLSKVKDLEHKKQAMHIELENYKAKEMFKKDNGLE